jgi:hypothetical protein
MPCYLLPANLLILPNLLTIEVGFNSQLDSIILQRAPLSSATAHSRWTEFLTSFFFFLKKKENYRGNTCAGNTSAYTYCACAH